MATTVWSSNASTPAACSATELKISLTTQSADLATQAAAMLSAADLRAAARFYGSPVYVAMRRKAAPAMTDPVVMAMPGCGNVPRRLDVADMGARGMRLLTAQEKAQVAAFTFSPAGQHLVRVAPQLMAAVQASYRQVAIRAAHDSGLVPAPLPAAAPPSPESLDLGPIRP